MATYKHIRSATANKRPTTSIADGQLAINTNTASPGLFFKDSAGTGIVKVGPVHVGTTAPNSTPAAGGSSGNYLGEQWLDTSVSPAQMKVWNGSAWVGVVADELPVSKLQDGTARQLIQTDAAGTGVEWTSNIDVPGTLDVTSTATFDSIARHPLGTAGAPTITFTGDTNTGIYSPGADQVAISTNGTGRLFVASDGKIGVNTASPSGLLHVANTGTAGTTADNLNTYFSSTSRNSSVYILAKNTEGSNLYFGDADSNTVGGLVYDHTNNYLRVDANGSERLRITSDGKLGLGTSSPGQLLHIAGIGAVAAAIQTNSANNNAALHFLNSSGAIKTAFTCDTDTGAEKFYLSHNGVDALVIDSSQRVGIGTTNPGYKLDVASTTGEVDVAINSASGSDGRIRFAEAGTNKWTLVNQAASDNLALFDNTANSQRLTIDSSGRLLVGTSSAFGSGLSQVATSNSHAIDIGGFNTFAANAGRLTFYRSKNGTIGSGTVLAANDSVGRIDFRGYDSNTYELAAQIQCEVDGTPGDGDMPGRLVFSTTADNASSPTERMRIGNVGDTISYANNGRTTFTASTAGAANTSSVLFRGRYSATGTTDGTACFYVYANGDVENTNNSYGAISDIKLKENIVDANSQWDDLKALQVRNYNFKEGQTHTQIGLIAQEAELISPGLVSESPDRDEDGNDLGTVTKSVNYSVLYMKAVKALQEAMERIEALEAKVAALEGV